MLSLRTTPVAPQTTYGTETTSASQPTDQFVRGELETTPWEGLRIRSAH